jgi:hypothetical protein
LRRSIMLDLMRREQVAWETRKSVLASLSQKDASQRLPSGPLPGGELQRRLLLPSLTDEKSSSSTVITSNQNSPRKLPPPITNSSSTTSHYVMRSPPDNTSSSRTTRGSVDFTQPSSCQTELKVIQTDPARENLQKIKGKKSRNYATSTTQVPAEKPTLTASTDISAKSVESLGMARRTARMEPSELYGLQPRYLRHNLWEDGLALSPTTAEWSEHAKPLPRPPLSEILDSVSAQPPRPIPSPDTNQSRRL